jgi:SAM-dependent methyltransferase
MVILRRLDRPALIRQAYDQIHATRGFQRPASFRRWLLNLCAAEPGMRLLDVACGAGAMLCLAHGRGVRAAGIDISTVALRQARTAETGLILAVANGEDLPFADDSFDRVASIGSLEHFQHPLRSVAEMARVLRPHGLACLLMPNSFSLRCTVPYAWRHGTVYDDGQPVQIYGNPGQWTALLEAGGMLVERIVGCESPLRPPRRPLDYVQFLRHPSRLIVPLRRWLPVSMATELVFLCRKMT